MTAELRLTVKTLASGASDSINWEIDYSKANAKIIADAAWQAMEDVKGMVQREGRASIASGGLGPKWQKALRVDRYPSEPSIDAAVYVSHKIPYAGIFETGGIITGRPLVWIPTRNAPARIAGKRPTPALFARAVGPLRSVNVPGNPPMLVGRFGRSREVLPMFIGVRSLRMRKLFDVGAAVVRGRDAFPQFYDRRIAEKA
jgi:hypothetical protein